MAFFKGAADQEVKFATEHTGGVSSFFGSVAKIANRVQNRDYEKQLVFNLKKTFGREKTREPVFNGIEEADAPEADWWSGGKEAVVVTEQFERSDSEESVEDSDDYTSDEDDILDEEDEFDESRPARIEEAPKTRPSTGAILAPSIARTSEKPLLTETEPKKIGAPQDEDLPAAIPVASKGNTEKTGGTKDKGKDATKTRTQKGAGKAEKSAGSEAKTVVKGAGKAEKSAGPEAKTVVKSKGDKSKDAEGKPGKGKPGGSEERAKKPKKGKDSPSKAAASKSRGGPTRQAQQDPFADSDSGGSGRLAPAQDGKGGPKPQPPPKARDPFADSDSDDGSKARQSGVQATTIGRGQSPGGATPAAAAPGRGPVRRLGRRRRRQGGGSVQHTSSKSRYSGAGLRCQGAPHADAAVLPAKGGNVRSASMAGLCR